MRTYSLYCKETINSLDIGRDEEMLNMRLKGLVLDQFITLTGYNRSYASGILNLREGKVVGYAKVYGMRIRYVIGKNKMIKRKRVEYMA